jgi:hypothetical protein
MNAHVLAKEIDKLLFVYLDTHSWIESTLNQILYLDNNAQTYLLDFETFLREILRGDSFFFDKMSKCKNIAREVQTYIQAIQKKLIKISAKELFPRLAQLETSLQIIMRCLEHEAVAIKVSISILNKFSVAYDTYLTARSQDAAIHVFLAAIEFKAHLQFLRHILHLLRDNLEFFQVQNEAQGILSLLFYKEVAFEHMMEKLNAIQILYQKLYLLFDNTAPTDNPIRLFKIKSGKIWIKIIGEAKVTHLMQALIKSTASFVYAQQSSNGKLVTIPREIDALDKVLHFSQHLQTVGIQALTIQDYLQKTALEVITQLNLLIIDQPRIEINDTLYALKGDEAKKLLPLKEAFLLKSRRNTS